MSSFHLQPYCDSLHGHELAPQWLRIASILMPLAGYVGPLERMARIGNFVIPCVGHYVGSSSLTQLEWELGDRIVGEVCLALGPKWFFIFGAVHSTLEITFSKTRSEQALSTTLAALYGIRFVFSRHSVTPLMMFALGARNGLRGYRSYKKGDVWEALAHLLVGVVRGTLFTSECFPWKKDGDPPKRGGCQPSSGARHWHSRYSMIGSSWRPDRFSNDACLPQAAVTPLPGVIGTPSCPPLSSLISSGPSFRGFSGILPHSVLAMAHSPEEKAERAQELREQAQSERSSAGEHLHDAARETLNGNFGNAVEHLGHAAKDYFDSRCDDTTATLVESGPDCYWEAMEEEGYTDSPSYPWND